MAESPPANNDLTSESQTPTPHFFERGISGLKRVGGLLQEEYNPRLKGQKWIRTVTEMRNDADLAAAMNAIEFLIRQAPMEVKPKADDKRPEAHRVAERIEQARGDMEHTWGELLSEMLTAIAYGFAPFEPVYKICRGDSRHAELRSKYDDGFIGWRKIALRSQDSLASDPWEFVEGTNELKAMRQQAYPDFRLRGIPIDKLLLFKVLDYKGSPEGRSLFRAAYDSWWFGKRVTEFEAIGVEKDLAGMLVVEIPVEAFTSGATADQISMRSHFEQMVPRVRNGEYGGVVFPTELDRHNNPTGYKIRLLQSGGRRPMDVDAIVRRHSQKKLTVFHAQFLTLGQNKVGSLALSSDQTDFFSLALGAILDAICDLFNRIEIPHLCKLNGIPSDLFPELTHGDVEKVNLVELSQFISNLSGTGHLPPSQALTDHLKELADLPVEESESLAEIPPEMLDEQIGSAAKVPSDLLNSQIEDLGPGYAPTNGVPREMLAESVE